MISTGDYVMYGAAGVCRIAAFEEKVFDGIHKSEYCRLKPVFSSNSVYYIPSASLEQRVRTLITREELDGIIQRMPSISALKVENSHQKKELFSSILKSGNYEKLVSMIKLLYAEKLQRSAVGKKLNVTDERVMHDAEELINQEFSIVLNIDKDSVRSYIESALSVRKQ